MNDMRLGLFLRNWRPRNAGQNGQHIEFLPGTVIDDGGFSQPPTVEENIGGGIVIKGKKASGATGKFIYDIGPALAGTQYTLKYDPDWSQLANGGVTAMVGFGLKNGNSFRLSGLKGNGSTGINAHEVHGTNWNKTSGFTEFDGGVAQHGTQAGPNWLRFVVSADGLTYTVKSSSDGVTWTDEFTDVVPTPHSTVTGVPTFGIAVFLQANDAGNFTVAITLWTSEAAEGGAAPTITTVYDIAITSGDAGWAGYNIIHTIAAGNLSAPSVTGRWGRLTLEFNTFSSGAVMSSMYCGKVGGSLVQVRFAGVGSITGDGATLVYVSDWFQLSEDFDEATNYDVTLHFNAGGTVDLGRNSGGAVGNSTNYKLGADEASAPGGGYTFHMSNSAHLVKKIEIATAQP